MPAAITWPTLSCISWVPAALLAFQPHDRDVCAALLSPLFSLFILACGIGRLDRWTKRCLKRFFLDADSLPLCLLHGKTGYKKISAGSFFLCLRAYEQAHGCYSSVVMILLDYWPLAALRRRGQLVFMAVERKDSFFYFVRGSCYHQFYTPNNSSLSILIGGSNCQRARFFYDLSGKNFLASWSGYFLSLFSSDPAGSYIRIFTDSCYHYGSHCNDETSTVSFYRMAVVRNNHCPGYRNHSDRRLAITDRYIIFFHRIAIMLSWEYLLWLRVKKQEKYFIPGGNSSPDNSGGLSWKQCGYWKNSIELFNHALQWQRIIIWRITVWALPCLKKEK